MENNRLLQDDEGQVIGATIHDLIGKKSFNVYAKQVGQ